MQKVAVCYKTSFCAQKNVSSSAFPSTSIPSSIFPLDSNHYCKMELLQQYTN